MKISELKKGDYFKKKQTSQKVFIYDGKTRGRYNTAFTYYSFDDISEVAQVKKNIEVFTEFEF
jgi:hypothetical protein